VRSEHEDCVTQRSSISPPAQSCVRYGHQSGVQHDAFDYQRANDQACHCRRICAKAPTHCFDFDVTLSSPYDTPQRYADAFRVTTLDGKVLSERILLHDHQNEQPFTRDLYGVKIPVDTKQVMVQGRDQKFGWGGKSMTVTLPGR
jgi:hypothetical protein